MANVFQERLVGTSVLLAVLVIVLPDLLSGKEDRPEDTFKAIPIKPATIEVTSESVVTFDAIEVAKPTPEFEQSHTDLVIKQANQESASSPKQNAQSTVDDTTAWTIQLGSFSDAKNAERLKSRLAKRRFNVYIRQFERNGKQLHNVYVGPNTDRSKLEQYLDTLAKEINNKPIIVKYEID